MRESYEEHERTIEPHRVEEQQNARLEAEARLRDRGIPVDESDSDEELVEVLEAIERFESYVEALGGDLMVNRIGSPEPQDADFVPPVRKPGESAYDYRDRILAAASELKRRQRAD